MVIYTPGPAPSHKSDLISGRSSYCPCGPSSFGGLLLSLPLLSHPRCLRGVRGYVASCYLGEFPDIPVVI